MHDRPVLVTGAQGQLGWELVRQLGGRGVAVHALDRGQLDLADLDAVRTAVRAIAPRLILNAAAYTAVDKAESDEAQASRINGDLPGVLGGLAREAGVPLIHYSTDYVFDGSKAGPYREDDPPAPLNAYGRTKLAGERAVAASGADHLILRTSWVYGRRGANFLLTMLRLAGERDVLRIVDDQIGAPTWCATIAAATLAVLDAPAARARPFPSGVYHLTAAGATSWHGFAEAIFALARPARVPRLEAIPTSAYPLPARRPANSRLDCSKLSETFGVTLPDWREALADCLVQPDG